MVTKAMPHVPGAVLAHCPTVPIAYRLEHTKFVKKMGTVLLGIQRDSISMDELHGKLASHPNVRDAIVQFSIGCGAYLLEPPKSLFKPLENALTMGS